MDVTDDLVRRLKAARTLAGIDSVVDLAERLDSPGLGHKTLYAIEQQRRKGGIGRHELHAIADVCDLPYEFFTVPDLAEAVRLGAAALSERDATGVAEALTADQAARRSDRSA